MKKVLSFFLAILMVLSLASTIVISASAEESKGDGSISVAMDSNKWDQCVLKENWEGQDKVQYRGFAAGSSHGAGGFMFRYGEGNTVAATDISGMKYIEFDVYVSNVADIANVEFSFELTSKGTADQQEISKKFTGASTGWTNGWNHVKWALTEFTGKTGGEFDATKWNFIRWYNDTTLKVGAEKLMVSIANLKFTVDTEIVVPSIDHAVPGWEITPEKWNAAFDLKTPDGTNAYLLRKWDANATLGVNHYNMFWIVETDNGCVSFDVSTADTFALDMWISDVSMVTGKQFQIELANGGFGGIDTNEATYNGTLDALVEGGLQNGWNTIKLPIASMGKTGNGADWTKIDWFRLYNAENITTGANGLSVAIDNVRFLKGDNEVAVMSECEPTMNGWQKNARPIVIDGVEAMGQTWTSDIAAGGYFTFRN